MPGCSGVAELEAELHVGACHYLPRQAVEFVRRLAQRAARDHFHPDQPAVPWRPDLPELAGLDEGDLRVEFVSQRLEVEFVLRRAPGERIRDDQDRSIGVVIEVD